MTTRRLISVTVFCIYLTGVLYLCFARPDDIPQLPELWFGLPSDKAGHFLMFLPFPLLGCMAFENYGMGISKKLVVLAVLIAAGIGIAAGTEHIQGILGYRSTESSDLLADGVGLFCGGIVCMIHILTKKSR